MTSSNSIFEKMVEEATERVAQKGWQKATQKEITLAAFGMLSRMLKNDMSSLKKPFWWAAGVITAGVLTYIIGNFLG